VYGRRRRKQRRLDGSKKRDSAGRSGYGTALIGRQAGEETHLLLISEALAPSGSHFACASFAPKKFLQREASNRSDTPGLMLLLQMGPPKLRVDYIHLAVHRLQMDPKLRVDYIHLPSVSFFFLAGFFSCKLKI
jgi:hypothetical protein